MKTVIASVMIFVLLLGFGTFSYYYIEKTAHKLLVDTLVIEKNIEAGNWQGAEKRFDKLKVSWSKTRSKWTVLIDHHELDSINVVIARMEKFLETKAFPELMAELSQLKLMFQRIPEQEALNLENIL